MGDFANKELSAPGLAHSTVYPSYKSHFGAREPYAQLQILEAIRSLHPDKHITTVSSHSANLIDFAEAGHADASLIRQGDEFLNQRTYQPPASRMESGDGKISEKVNFGLYDYEFKGEKSLVYSIEYPSNRGVQAYQYILMSKAKVVEAHCSLADDLIKAAGKWTHAPHEEVYVFDSGMWIKSRQLWEAVQSASWSDVILESAMKDTLINDVESFFDSRVVYMEYSVPWKRGIIFHGMPGCGKTISIKALMNTLQKRDVASLYVKSFEGEQGPQQSIRAIFQRARVVAPCLLIFEDLDSLVVDKVRSYFLNEVDGLENNDGILMIGSTNHLDRLDPGISKRPSRFDRKYHYQLPGAQERVAYCDYWRTKLQKNNNIEFDEEICDVVSQFTDGFSFAYLKELFVQTLLTLVSGRAHAGDDEEDTPNTAKLAENTKVVEGSAKLIKEGETLESTAGSAADPQTGKEQAEHKMPEVEIPDRLQANPLMRILHKQAKALWTEMDNTNDDIHGRAKVAGGRAGRAALRQRVMIAQPPAIY